MRRTNRPWTQVPGVEIPGSIACSAYVSGPLRAIVGWEGPAHDRRWHLSVSRDDRYPSWDEIADARYDLLPLTIDVAMLLPRPEKYVNCHRFCFHLWEIKDPWLPHDQDGLTSSRTREDGTAGQEAGPDDDRNGAA